MYVVLTRREVGPTAPTGLAMLGQIDALGPYEDRAEAVRLTKDLQLAGHEAILRFVLPEGHANFPDVPRQWREVSA